MKIIISLLLMCGLINAQISNPTIFNCEFQPGAWSISAPSLIGGLHKPESIERYTSNQDAYFPVIIVYAQFLNDPGPDWSECYWHINQAPNYMGTTIALQKRTSSDWWNAYSETTERLSDYWMEVSRGKLHLVGKEVHILLPYEVSYYNQFQDGVTRVMEDIFVALQNHPDIYWPSYDLWSRDENGNFQYNQPDGFVDMVYIVGRSNPCNPNWTGSSYFRPQSPFESCFHSPGHTVYQSGSTSIKLLPSFGPQGSGFQISPGHGGDSCENWVLYVPLEKWAMVSFSGHEHGHYFFGWSEIGWLAGHQQYSKVNNFHGLEEYLSPYELIRLGYHIPQNVNFSITNSYSINDFVSFDQNPYSQILKVPIGDASRNEFFLIANRQHTSSYDHLMWGDTAHSNPYRNVNQEYDKGVYIYHTYPGLYGSNYPWGIDIDMETADGLWNWVQDGYRNPYWSCTQLVEYYKRLDPVYNLNDNGGEGYQQLLNHDGKSIYRWFSIGKKKSHLVREVMG